MTRMAPSKGKLDGAEALAASHTEPRRTKPDHAMAWRATPNPAVPCRATPEWLA